MQNKQALVVGGATVALLGMGYKLYKDRQNEKIRFQQQNNLEQGGQYLKQQTAIERRDIVDGYVDYELLLCTPKDKQYSGIVQMNMGIKKLDDLLIDYQGKQVLEVKVNNKVVKDINALWNKYFLLIPKEYLKLGSNVVTILFINNYALDGEGLHSFIDTDNKQYIYSDCEPAYARKWFPCLDQPDIKGCLDLYTIVPKDWVAISNEQMVEEPCEVQFNDLIKLGLQIESRRVIQQSMNVELQNMNLYNFQRTTRLSTYLFHLSCGPYKQIKAEETYKNIPMSLYCRESCYQDLLKQQVIYFETVSKCMKFYEEFFQFNYPYSKYDHIFCPQFNSGAMENAGAITVNDLYIFKDKVKKSTRAFVFTMITHELCHMWFGDLVTMKWWNDLWLNESFADYLSYFACSNFEVSFDKFDAYADFNDRKSWGYTTDMSNGTHPIAGEVMDTQQARNIFDGITYSKGASVIKQLFFLLSPQKFSKAMAYYFKKHQYKNTTLDDFIEALSTQFDNNENAFTLEEWKKDWIETAGCNSLEPVWKDKKLFIKQESVIEQFSHRRYHKIKIALFKSDNSFITKDVMVKNQQWTEVDVDLSQEYEGVLLNYDDHDFCKVIIDQKSFSYFSDKLYLVKEIVNQKVLVRALFEMIKDGKLTSLEFITFVKQNIKHQLNSDIVATLIQYLDGAIYHYSPLSQHKQLYEKSYDLVMSEMMKCNLEEDQDKIIVLSGQLIRFAQNDHHVQQMLQWLNEELNINGIEKSYYNKWAIIRLIHQQKDIHAQVKQQILEKQLNEDKSDYGNTQKIICETLNKRSASELQQLWNNFIQPKEEIAKKEIEAMMEGFNTTDKDLSKFHELYFHYLEIIYKNQAQSYASSFLLSLFPISDDFSYLQNKLQELLNKVDKQQSPSLYQKLQTKLDYVNRREITCKYFMSQH